MGPGIAVSWIQHGCCTLKPTAVMVTCIRSEQEPGMGSVNIPVGSSDPVGYAKRRGCKGSRIVDAAESS